MTRPPDDAAVIKAYDSLADLFGSLTTFRLAYWLSFEALRLRFPLSLLQKELTERLSESPALSVLVPDLRQEVVTELATSWLHHFEQAISRQIKNGLEPFAFPMGCCGDAMVEQAGAVSNDAPANASSESSDALSEKYLQTLIRGQTATLVRGITSLNSETPALREQLSNLDPDRLPVVQYLEGGPRSAPEIIADRPPLSRSSSTPEQVVSSQSSESSMGVLVDAMAEQAGVVSNDAPAEWRSALAQSKDGESNV